MQLRSRYPLNAAILQQRAIYEVTDDIQVNTATSLDEPHRRSPLTRGSTKCSYGKPNEAHIRVRSSLPRMSSLPAMSVYESNESSPLKEEKETHVWSRTIALSKYVIGGDPFHHCTICASDMKYTTIELTYEDEELYNRITPKAENHCPARSALLLRYAYRYITRM